MIGLPVWMAVACIVVVYVGTAVQASIGIGMGMLASPVLALTDPDFIPVAIVILVIPLTGAVAWAERAHIDRRGLGLSLVGRVPGVVTGALVAASLSDRVLALLVAASVLFAVVVSATARRFRPTDQAIVTAGLASGFAATTTGVGGPPMALVYQHRDPEIMRGTISAYFTIGAGMSLVALALAGEVGRRQFELTALLLPSVVLGTATALAMRRRLDPATVRPAVLAVCTIAAVALIVETFV